MGSQVWSYKPWDHRYGVTYIRITSMESEMIGSPVESQRPLDHRYGVTYYRMLLQFLSNKYPIEIIHTSNT